MSGFDLDEGTYDRRKITEEEIWNIFEDIFSTRSKNSTSYKFGFLKCILDNLYNVDEELKLSFDILFNKFVEIYWNLVLKYHIRQMPVTKNKKGTVLERDLKQGAEKFQITEEITYESIPVEAMEWLTNRVKKDCMKNVVGALFNDGCKFLYSFSKEEEWIQMNPIVYEFLLAHRGVIEKINYYEWAKYLEKINEEDVTNELLSKLDACAKRTNLSVYRNILFDEFETRNCFYCGKNLNGRRGVEVDHFVPWSLIKDDKLWNLVLACTDCNRRKSDRIPDAMYLDKIIERNRVIKDSRQDMKEMRNYEKGKLIRLYEGVRRSRVKEGWKPKC